MKKKLRLILELWIYLYPIRKLAEVKIFSLIELNRVGILPGQLLPLQTLLQLRCPVQSASQVADEDQNDQNLDGPLVDIPGQSVTEPNHDGVVWVVFNIVGVFRVDTTWAEHAVQPRFVACEWERGFNVNYEAISMKI